MVCLGFLATPCPGAAAARETPVPRTVLCLYGFAPGDPARAPVWPPDTYSAQMLQMALEWMGYEMEFHDVGKGRPPQVLDAKYCAVILDSALELPYDDEEFYFKWIISQRDRRLKLLFLGGYPGSRKELRAEFAAALGIRGGLDEIIGAKSSRFLHLDKSMVNADLLPRPRTNGLVAALAPEGSRVWLSITATDQRGTEKEGDAVYTTDWGGAVLEPYLYFRTSPDDVHAVIDPFAYLATLVPANAFPVPDSTTRDGLRMFETHIDGDGFATLSKKHLNVTCAEIMRDEFLKKYPFPITVSVIQAEIQGLVKDQSPADCPRYEDIARSIFALENVHGASHAFSHPFVWMPGLDIEGAKGYATPWLEFTDPAAYPKFDLHREIEGSVRYIQDALMPPGKKLEVFLWSGNCRPSGEALRMVSSLGLEAFNGGNTIINRRAEGIAAISSKDTFMDGELQVYSPVQNEFTYTNGFTGPLYGGYRLVLDTFERTGTPRRLKPVNMYFHFYSVQSGESQAALHDVYEWCLKQPLHSISARDFVLLVKDCRGTRLYSAGPHRWIAENTGHCRTFRVPAHWGPPYLPACEGVTGFNTEQDQTYVHTDGRPRVVMDFTANPQSQPWLVSSSGDITLAGLTADEIKGSVQDLRTNQVVFGGLALHSTLILRYEKSGNSVEIPLSVDNAGHLNVNLPPACEFSLSRVAH
ncbi:MAG: hypothetical protein JWO94_273 [Verrucomicrobiaceae bacterium]|nr:hypothetical protein [Verrucomicrobiaceae bacterium]